MRKPEEQSFAVIGLGKFGSHIARELAYAGAHVLAIDINEERVADIAEYVTYAVKADVCDEKAMQALGLSNMDAVVVAITGNLEAGVMATILAKEAGVKTVIAKAKEEIHAKVLQRTGADRVIIPEKDSGIRIAHNILAGNFVDVIEVSQTVRIVEMEIKPEWIGKTLKELKFRNKYQANVIAVKNNMEADAQTNVDPDMELQEGMILWLIMDKNHVERLL